MKDLNNYNITTYEYKKKIVELEKKINELENKNNEETSRADKYNKELQDTLNSISWKITKPLRKASSIIKGSKKTEIKEEEIIVEEIKNNYQDENNYAKFPIYTSEYQDNIDFSSRETDIKTIAFYLPQYHQFKENDEWWGEGFTEWTNTKKSTPKFEGHYQPREPHQDIGYYKLDNIDTIKKQVALAKQHGIYGFCFYYYWFSGKRLMEKPLDLYLENPDIDFPFCLCWANENWTKAWDGKTNDILIKQEYAKEDSKKFIKDIKKYILDKRYIRIDDKPLIIVYNPTEIPNFAELTKKWREYAKEEEIGEIYICSKCDLANNEYKYTEYVDAEFDFPPQGIGHKESLITGLSSPKIYNYKRIVDDIEHLYRNHFPLKTFFYTCTMGWDNSARRKENYTIYYNYSLESYYKWLRILIEETRRRNSKDKRFLFINAWNEWAEGTYLEPDAKYGYANINTLSKAIYDLPLNSNGKITKPMKKHKK